MGCPCVIARERLEVEHMRAFVFLICLITCCVAISGCDPRQECQGSNVSYIKCIRPALRANCSGDGCHGGAQPAVALDLETVGKIYPGLFKQVFAGDKTYEMVKAGDPDNSYLMIKMRPNPPVGDQMPPYLRPILSDSQMKMFTTWINEGAKNDDPDYKPTGTVTVEPPKNIPADVKDVSYETVIKPLLAKKCGETQYCHTATDKAANVDLITDAYTALVGVQSLSKKYEYVTASKPLESLLYIKLLETRPTDAGSKMPPGASLSEKEIAQIYVWINEGAKKN